MDTAKKNEFVQIKVIELEPKDRKKGLPEDTAKVPFVALIMGYLEDETAKIGDTVTICTPIGRKMQGELHAVNPSYGYDFGAPIPELLGVGPELHAILDKVEKEAQK